MSGDENNGRLEQEVAHFLATGECDPLGGAFPGAHALERITGYERHLRMALLTEVRQRERGRRQDRIPQDFDAVAWTRRKVQPMIDGLFQPAERSAILEVAARSIVFLTRDAAHRAIRENGYLESAWKLANIYLHSLGAPVLGGEQNAILGMSEETTCYVSTDYFVDQDPYADYVVHEVAHIFHNCKRQTLELPHSQSREWLLDIAYAKRETFAYACELYSRILEQGRDRATRSALLARYAESPKCPDGRVDADELNDVLKEAVPARNGWKCILARCSNPPQANARRQNMTKPTC